MIKLGTMSLNIKNTTASDFAQVVYDLGLDVIELHSSAFESTDVTYLRNIKKDLMRKTMMTKFRTKLTFYNRSMMIYLKLKVPVVELLKMNFNWKHQKLFHVDIDITHEWDNNRKKYLKNIFKKRKN